MNPEAMGMGKKILYGPAAGVNSLPGLLVLPELQLGGGAERGRFSGTGKTQNRCWQPSFFAEKRR